MSCCHCQAKHPKLSKEIEDYASVASSDTKTNLTPTETTEQNGPWNMEVSNGKTYMIRHRDSGKVIMVVDGEVLVDADIDTKGGFRWHCEEISGWLAFREAVSGIYLSHEESDDEVRFVPEGKVFDLFTRFQIRPHRGGHYLLATEGSGMIRVGLYDNFVDETRLIGADSVAEAVVWEFVEL
jgi:hypothetical protein